MNIAQTNHGLAWLLPTSPERKGKEKVLNECVMHRLRKGEDKEQVQKDGKRMEADNIIMKEV